jgi:hypothetical protein
MRFTHPPLRLSYRELEVNMQIAYNRMQIAYKEIRHAKALQKQSHVAPAFLYQSRPDILYPGDRADFGQKAGRFSKKSL